MVRIVKGLTLYKYSVKRLKERMTALQNEGIKIALRMRRCETKKSHKTRAYRTLIKRAKKITSERNKTKKYLVIKLKRKK